MISFEMKKKVHCGSRERKKIREFFVVKRMLFKQVNHVYVLKRRKIKRVVAVVCLENGDDILFSRKVLRYLILQHCLSDCDKDTGYLLEWVVAASLCLSLSLPEFN